MGQPAGCRAARAAAGVRDGAAAGARGRSFISKIDGLYNTGRIVLASFPITPFRSPRESWRSRDPFSSVGLGGWGRMAMLSFIATGCTSSV